MTARLRQAIVDEAKAVGCSPLELSVACMVELGREEPALIVELLPTAVGIASSRGEVTSKNVAELLRSLAVASRDASSPEPSP